MTTIELAEETTNLTHRLNLIALRMFNAKKRTLTEEEVLKLLLIQETLEDLIKKVTSE